MSSKTQYREALKRDKTAIESLKRELAKVNVLLQKERMKVKSLQDALDEKVKLLVEASKSKKWYQFWK
jgi:transcription antitermination factor NusA-like protein